MIDYVDKLLKHWAQELRVSHSDVNLGFKATWVDGAISVGGRGVGRYTARGTATRPSHTPGKIGKVAERVNQAIERLPDQFQTVISVQYLERPGDTKEQKAERLGCSVKTFYKHIHKVHELLSTDLPDAYANFMTTYPHCG